MYYTQSFIFGIANIEFALDHKPTRHILKDSGYWISKALRTNVININIQISCIWQCTHEICICSLPLEQSIEHRETTLIPRCTCQMIKDTSILYMLSEDFIPFTCCDNKITQTFFKRTMLPIPCIESQFLSSQFISGTCR